MKCSRKGCESSAVWQVGVRLSAVNGAGESGSVDVFLRIACCEAHKQDPGEVGGVLMLCGDLCGKLLSERDLWPDWSGPEPAFVFKPLRLDGMNDVAPLESDGRELIARASFLLGVLCGRLSRRIEACPCEELCEACTDDAELIAAAHDLAHELAPHTGLR